MAGEVWGPGTLITAWVFAGHPATTRAYCDRCRWGATPGSRLEVVTEDGVELTTVTAALPFVDTQKKVPVQRLSI